MTSFGLSSSRLISDDEDDEDDDELTVADLAAKQDFVNEQSGQDNELDPEELAELEFDLSLSERHRTDDKHHELAGLISGIGSYDRRKDKFIRGEYCSESIARLDFLLRRDICGQLRNENDLSESDKSLFKVSELYRLCGDFDLVRNSLRPMLIQLRTELAKLSGNNTMSNRIQIERKRQRIMKIVMSVIKIVARLTNPILTYDRDFANIQRIIKDSMISDEVLSFILLLMSDPLTIETEDRSESDSETLELFLYLIRNLLRIPNAPMSSLYGCSLSSGQSGISELHLSQVHDRCIVSMTREGIMDVCVELASNAREESESVSRLLIGIFYHYFRLDLDHSRALLRGRLDPSASKSASRSNGSGNHVSKPLTMDESLKRKSDARARRARSDGQKCSELRRLAEMDKAKRLKISGRHCRWGGVKQVRSLGGSVSVVRGASAVGKAGLSARSARNKASVGGGTRMALESIHARRKSAKMRPKMERMKRLYLNERVRDALCYVCDKFVGRSLNGLMIRIFESLKELIEHELRESKICRYWVRLAYFVLEYARIKNEFANDVTNDNNNQHQKDTITTVNISIMYDLSRVSCLIKPSMFEFVLQYASMLCEGRKIKHLGITGDHVEESARLLKEMLGSLHCCAKQASLMTLNENDDKSTNQSGDSSVVTNYNLIQEQKERAMELFEESVMSDGTARSILFQLLDEFKPSVNTNELLQSCIECIHFICELSSIQKQRYDPSLMVSNHHCDISEDNKSNNSSDDEYSNDNNTDDTTNDDDLDDEKMKKNEHRRTDHILSVNVDVIRVYLTNRITHSILHLLKDYQTNEAHINEYIAQYLSLYRESGKEGLLYQLSYLILFEEILDDDDEMILNKPDHHRCPHLHQFCVDICGRFLKQASEENPVLWCDALFLKSGMVLNDIDEPGLQSNYLNALREGSSKKKRDRHVMAIDGFEDWDEDNDNDDEWGDDDTYQLKEYREWAPEEDECLRSHFETYSDQPNREKLLSGVLQSEVHSERDSGEIRRRLKQLGLLLRRRKKAISGVNAAMAKSMAVVSHRRKWKRPSDSEWLTKEVRESLTWDLLNAAEERRGYVECWMVLIKRLIEKVVDSKLDNRHSLFTEPLSLIPITLREFHCLEDICIRSLMKRVGFVEPSVGSGFSFWKAPVGYTGADLQNVMDTVDSHLKGEHNEDESECIDIEQQSMDEQPTLDSRDEDEKKSEERMEMAAEEAPTQQPSLSSSSSIATRKRKAIEMDVDVEMAGIVMSDDRQSPSLENNAQPTVKRRRLLVKGKQSGRLDRGEESDDGWESPDDSDNEDDF